MGKTIYVVELDASKLDANTLAKAQTAKLPVDGGTLSVKLTEQVGRTVAQFESQVASAVSSHFAVQDVLVALDKIEQSCEMFVVKQEIVLSDVYEQKHLIGVGVVSAVIGKLL